MRGFRAFLRDEECGSSTLWNLFWLTGSGALLGIGVDTTAAMNTKARLQTVADAASHAAAMDLFPVADAAVDTALAYALQNLPAVEGVVQPADITLGYWNRGTRSFETEGVPYLNAVRVVAGRDEARANALATSFLQWIGLREWDIAAVSTAAYFSEIEIVDRCHASGLMAGGTIEFTSNNIITGVYCVHGEAGLKIAQNNIVTCEVQVSTPSPAHWLSNSVPPPSGEPGECDTDYEHLSNEEMVEQTVIYRSLKSHAQAEYDKLEEMVEAFMEGTLDNDPFNAIPPYLTSTQTVTASTFNTLSEKGDLVQGVLYRVPCSGNDVLRPSGLIRNVGIYTDCIIDVRKDTKVAKQKPEKTEDSDGQADSGELCDPDIETCEDVPWIAEILPPMLTCETAIAEGYEAYTTGLDTASGRTYRDGVTVDADPQECAKEPGANGLWDNVFVFSTAFAGGDASQTALSFPNNMQIGRIDGCIEGGGARIYTRGSVTTPAGTVIHGSQFVVLGDVYMAAKVDGTYGLSIQAAGDISFAAQGNMGGCPVGEEQLASDVVVTVRPVAIVN